MTPIAYLRVSTIEQADSGAGLDAQRAAITAACVQRSWAEPSWRIDAGVSGSLPWHQRPELAAAIAELDAQRDGVLMVAKLDRLSRSTLDFLTLVERARSRGWGIVLLDMQLDTISPIGEMVATILAAFAQFERRLISQRTKDALAQKRAAGVRIGRPPRTELSEAERMIAQLRADGHTQTAIVAALNGAGGTKAPQGGLWSLSGVQRALARVERSAC